MNITITATASGVSDHTHVFNEDLTDQITGGGVTTLQTVNYISGGTLQFYYNGLRQRPTYYTTYSGNYINTTFTLSGLDEAVVDYIIDPNYSPPAPPGAVLLESGDNLLTTGDEFIILES